MFEDPKPKFPEHTVIDFTSLTGGQIRRKSKHLRSAALSRGWSYLPPTVEQVQTAPPA